MPPRKRTSSVLNGDDRDELKNVSSPDPVEVDGTDTGYETLSLADQAEAAEAEAAEAEAAAAAAKARTRALRLRRQAEAAATKAAPVTATAPVDLVKPPATAPAEVIAPVETADAEAEDLDAEELGPEELDAEELDAEYIDAEDEPVRRRRRPKMPHVSVRIVAAGLVVLLSLGLFGASAYMIVHHRQVAAEQQRSAEFAAAARQGVVTLMSLDFNKAYEDVKRIIDNTTGDFKKDFESQAPEFTQVAKESKVVTEATVNATAVDKMTRDTATVLVAVTTNVSNTASKEQQPRSWRLSVDVASDGGQIKLAKVEFVQ